MTRALSPSSWGQALLLLLIATGVYFPTWAAVWPYWHGEYGYYAHGTLVPFIAMWLAWRARPTVNQIEPMPSARTVPVVLLLSAIWVLAERASVFIVYATLWPILALGILCVGLGFQIAFRFIFPLSFLYFAIPIWDYLRPPLQAITSAMVGLFTQAFGISAALDGHYITLPTGKIFIAQGCSGTHLLCITLAVGVLAGVLRRDVLRTRILILVIAGLLSMATNWLRILLIIMAHLHPDLKEWMTINHITFGWLVFALGMTVFGLVLHFIPHSAIEQVEKSPVDRKIPIRQNNNAGLAMAIIAASILPAIAWALPRFDTYPTHTPNGSLGLWAANTNIISPDLRWRPYYPGTVWEDRSAFIADTGVVIEVYGNRYHGQSQEHELISGASHLFDPLKFAPESTDVAELRNSRGQPIQVHREVLSHVSGTSWVTLYTYFVDTESVTSGRRAQLMTALRSTYSRATAGVIAVAMPCVGTCESHIVYLEEAFIRGIEGYREALSE